MREQLLPLGQLLGLAVLWDASIPMRLPRVVTLSFILGPDAAGDMLVPSDLNEYSVAMAVQMSQAQHIATLSATGNPAQL